MKKSRFIGDRKFYAMAFAVALPIMVQNGVSSFVNLLDNLMVGSLGTEAMSGVSIANQILFVFNLCVFGGLAGAGIFGAQLHGKGDTEGVRSVFRVKLIIAAVLVTAAEAVFALFDEELIALFLHESAGEGVDPALTLHEAKRYLHIMLITLPPFALTQVYSSTLRETGETRLPMRAGIAAVMVNMVGNYILIYGRLGAPALGVEGAAIATALSRFVEVGIVAVWTHTHSRDRRFIVGAYRSLKAPAALWSRIGRKGLPLLANEFFWSCGTSFLVQCYSMRGLSVVAGLNIANTMTNLFSIGFLSLGNAVGIIVGNLLGADKMDEAVETDTRLAALSVVISAVLGVLLAAAAPLIPRLYNTTDEVRALAARFMWIFAACMPFNAVANVSYFTLRAGGRAFITVLFDSVYLWCVSASAAFLLSRFTDMNVLTMYAIVCFTDVIKAVIGGILLKKRIWVNNITDME